MTPWSPDASEMLPLKPKLRWLFMAPVPWEIKIAEHPSGEKVNAEMIREQILASPEQESTAEVPVRHLLTRQTSSLA